MANLLAVSDIFHWGAAAKITLLVAASVTLLIAVVVLIISICERKKDAAAKIYLRQAQEEPSPAEEPEQTPEPLPAEETAPEPVQEIAAAEEAEPVSEEIELTEEATLVDDAEDADVGTVIAGGLRIRVRYDRSFTAKLIQSDDELKARYSELKNELLSYCLKDRMSWSCETYRYKRVAYAKFAIRGKTLSLYLALDPEEFKESKYFYEDASDVNKYAAVPFRLKIKSDRGVKWAKELIAIMAEKFGLAKTEREAEDFTLPYEHTEALVRRKLIKLVRAKDFDFSALEKPAPEPVQEQEPVPEPEAQAGGEIILTEGAHLVEDAENADVGTLVVGGRNIAVRYDRSFTAKLVQSDDEIKARYSELKSELLSYGLKDRMSWTCETYRYKRLAYAKFAIRGKTLSIYLALDPAELAESKYFIEDVSGVSKYKNVPVRMKLKSNRSVKWAKELIALMMERAGLARGEAVEADCPEYRTTETLVNERLIRLYDNTAGAFLEKKSDPAEETAQLEVEEQPAEEIAIAEEEQPAEEIAIAEEEQPAEETQTTEVVEEQPVEETEETETAEVEEEQAVAEETAEAEEEQPAEEIAVAQEEQAVAEEIAVAEEEQPAEEIAEAEEEQPAEEIAVAQEEQPAEETQTTEVVEEQPVEETEETQTTEVVEEQPAEEIAEAEEEQPAEETQTTEVVEEQPAEEIAEAEEEQPAEEIAEAEEEQPAEETAQLEVEEQPAEEIAEAEEEQPVEETEETETEETQTAEPEAQTEEQPEKALPAEELREEVAAAQVSELMSDEEAEEYLVQKPASPSAKSAKPVKAVKAIVNISSLSANFEAGERVDLAALKRKKLVGQKTTYVKMLAKGTLNKPLAVEANDFSIEAVKMIVLTGGKAIKI